MPSRSTFSLLVFNPHKGRNQKHHIHGPGFTRKLPKPEKDQAWVQYDIVIEGNTVISLKESGNHLKSVPMALTRGGEPLRVLTVTMVVHRPWNTIMTDNDAVRELLAAMTKTLATA